MYVCRSVDRSVALSSFQVSLPMLLSEHLLFSSASSDLVDRSFCVSHEFTNLKAEQQYNGRTETDKTIGRGSFAPKTRLNNASQKYFLATHFTSSGVNGTGCSLNIVFFLNIL